MLRVYNSSEFLNRLSRYHISGMTNTELIVSGINKGDPNRTTPYFPNAFFAIIRTSFTMTVHVVQLQMHYKR
jgi:hypothetical protein